MSLLNFQVWSDMSNEQPARSKDSCPHCGKPVGLSWWTLLPSSERHRKLQCRACDRRYDLSDACKMSSMMGGLFGMSLAILFLFGRIVSAGHGSKVSVGAATVVVALAFALPAIAVARVTLRLEPKP